MPQLRMRDVVADRDVAAGDSAKAIADKVTIIRETRAVDYAR